MSYFLTKEERLRIINGNDYLVDTFYDSLRNRVLERIYKSSWLSVSDSMWWYSVTEYLSDAAMIYNLSSEREISEWIRNKTLVISEKSVNEWMGPSFRNHEYPYVGHLETAHICWGISSVLSLCSSLFSEVELENIQRSLKEKGVDLCFAWLRNNYHLGNWRGIMASGALIGSVVLNESDLINSSLEELELILENSFQIDGSYGESLQYGNYLAYALMLSSEVLFRYDRSLAERLDIEYYSKGIEWYVYSYMYHKSLKDDNIPKPRSVNFNDSAATFRPSGDLLLHIAKRYAGDDVNLKPLAGWLFDKMYVSNPHQGPHELASFGMYNDWGFLTLPLLTQTYEKRSPKRIGLDKSKAFSNGNVIIRDTWGGKSILAIQAGSREKLNVQGHLHGDLNSFILVYNSERLLIDPGHSCYRNIIHGIESASETHNTCTFLVQEDKFLLQEDLSKSIIRDQRNVLPRRIIEDQKINEPIDRLGRLVYCHRKDDLTIVCSEAGEAYGKPIQSFHRYWLQMGSHLTLVFDRIISELPVLTIWNWVLNNREGISDIKVSSNSISLDTQRAGMRMVSLGEGRMAGPIYGYCHDAYHPTPDQMGEGRLGSAEIYRIYDTEYKKEILRVHVIISDDIHEIGNWEYSEKAGRLEIEKTEEKNVIDITKFKGREPCELDILHNEYRYKIDLLQGEII